ncbi:MAG: branched-chain amino acid ABC transporter substrate-binding protein [Candidatus Electryoneaceae bacterium]|nr:branched-chain amino acid ABC transporter substrate-binding protein [Candidatus Electryoneaceae bacterium]
MTLGQRLWITVAAVLLLLIIGCNREKTIKIAVIAPMTGYSAKMGEDVSRGVQLAVDEWNAKGGILGLKVELAIEDDRADPKDAVSVANKAAAQDVIGVVGHYNSSCTIPASNIYNENNIIMITPSSTNPRVTDREFPVIFRNCGRDDQQGNLEATFAVQVLGAKRIAVLHDKTTYGQGLADEFKLNLPDTIEVVAYEGISIEDKDFTAVLTMVKSMEPDLLMFGGLYSQGGLIAKQMRGLGLECLFLSGDGVYDPEFIRIAGPASEGVYVSYAKSAENIPTAQNFLRNFRARWPEVGPYSMFAYDAANVILTAIDQTGSTDGQTIAEYIHNTTFSGSIGEIKYDHKGDLANSPYVMWQVVDGQLVQLDWDPPAPQTAPSDEAIAITE